MNAWRTMALGIAISLATGIPVVFLFAWNLSNDGVARTFLPHLPSIALVGLGVAWLSTRLRAPTGAMVIGVAFGWIAGTMVTVMFLIAARRESPIPPQILFSIPQIAIGTILGALPSVFTAKFPTRFPD